MVFKSQIFQTLCKCNKKCCFPYSLSEFVLQQQCSLKGIRQSTMVAYSNITPRIRKKIRQIRYVSFFFNELILTALFIYVIVSYVYQITVASLEGCDGCKCTRRFLRKANCTRQFWAILCKLCRITVIGHKLHPSIFSSKEATEVVIT